MATWLSRRPWKSAASSSWSWSGPVRRSMKNSQASGTWLRQRPPWICVTWAFWEPRSWWGGNSMAATRVMSRAALWMAFSAPSIWALATWPLWPRAVHFSTRRPRWAAQTRRPVGSPTTAPSKCPSSPRMVAMPLPPVSSSAVRATVTSPSRDCSDSSKAASRMAATEALASLAPRPWRRVPFQIGVKGSPSQPAQGGTVSRWEFRSSRLPPVAPKLNHRLWSCRCTWKPRAVSRSWSRSAMAPSPPDTLGVPTSRVMSSAGFIRPPPRPGWG